MKEAFDELKERLEEESMYSCFHCMDRAISIVSEVEAECGNGWIPCSERLPELSEGTECFKQSKCCLVTLKWFDGDITESIGWYNQSGVWNDDSKSCKVIAWMQLPSPYKTTTD